MNVSVLLWAIATVESGDAQFPNGNDSKIGPAGERSMYQISEPVWRTYNKRLPFTECRGVYARLAAIDHIDTLRKQLSIDRRDDPFWVAVAWTAWIDDASVSDRRKLAPKVRDYAERVTNIYDELAKDGRKDQGPQQRGLEHTGKDSGM